MYMVSVFQVLLEARPTFIYIYMKLMFNYEMVHYFIEIMRSNSVKASNLVNKIRFKILQIIR